MIEINMDELNSFSNNYYKEINEVETNINIIFEQLLSLKESINTPNITKKINEFNELFYQVKDSIKKNNENIDKQVKNVIKNYDNLYNDIKKEVNNE